MSARRWHPAVVHFPLACWVLATLLDIGHLLALDARVGVLDWSDVANLLLWIGLAFAALAVALGIVDFATLPRSVQDSAELMRHVGWMAAALLLFLGAAVIRVRAGGFAAPHSWYVVGLEAAGTTSLVAGGHYASIVVFERLPAAPAVEAEHGRER